VRAFTRTNFLHRRKRIFVSNKKKSGLYSWSVYRDGKAGFSRLPCLHYRAIFPGGFSPVVSWRATGYRWPMQLKLPMTGFNLQVGLFRASQTRRLPRATRLPLAGNSQFPANFAISCCVCLSHRRAVTPYFVRPSFRNTERRTSVLRRVICIATLCN